MNVKLKKFNILEPNVKIKAKIITEIPDPIQELSGTPPLTFKTVSNELLDWTITAVTDGVGKIGKNYLKPKTEPIPNGAAGSWLSNTAWITETLDQGYTFNTGEATLLGFEFKHEGDANILPAHIGDLMLVEGSTMPTQYDEETNLFKGTITNGCYAMSSYQDGNGYFEVGKTQYLYAGVGEDGINRLYYVAASRVSQRCKTWSFPVKKNTQYCVKSFNSAYNDIKISLSFLTESGTVTPTVTSYYLPQKSIPDNGTFDMNTEQWTELVCSHFKQNKSRIYNYPDLPIDARAFCYKYCDYFANLKAGTYKVMADVWGNYRSSGGWWVGASNYMGNVNDNWMWAGVQTNEWFVLLAEDNTQIIQKTEIIPTGTTRQKKISDGAPYPNYFHKEVTFTLASDTKVGLLHSAYSLTNTTDDPPFFRFYIVDSDVEAVEFTTTGADPCDMTGYSAWEKYNISLPIIVYKGDYSQAQRTVIDLGESYLEAGDILTMTDTGITVSTFEGENIINVDSAVQPNMYIKYRRF